MLDQKTAESICDVIVRRCANIMFDRGLAEDASVELTGFDEAKDEFKTNRRFARWFICPLDRFTEDLNQYSWQGEPDHIKKEGESVRVIKFRFDVDDENMKAVVEFDPMPGLTERIYFRVSADDTPEKLEKDWCIITLGRGVRVKDKEVRGRERLLQGGRQEVPCNGPCGRTRLCCGQRYAR